MTSKPARLSLWAMLPVGLATVLIAIGIELTDTSGNPLDWLIRGAALVGYQLVFLAIVSSAYLRQLVRLFGRSFIQIHHILSISGLVFISLHPLGVFIAQGTPTVFLPVFDSVRAFLELGGRPAWVLIALAAAAANWRRPIGSFWRAIHSLNYLAFLLATIHANLIGTNLRYPVPKAITLALALVTLGVFVQKRWPRAKASRVRS